MCTFERMFGLAEGADEVGAPGGASSHVEFETSFGWLPPPTG